MTETIQKIIEELEKMNPRYHDSVLNFVIDSNKEGCAKDFYKKMWRSQYENHEEENYRETDGTTEEEV